MILDAISLVDCVFFVVFLAPQLILQVGVIDTLTNVLQMLPFLLISLPYQLIRYDLLAPNSQRAPFHRVSPFFTNLVIRCVRYAFAFLPARLGAVFFSKPVAFPFAQWRMLRHGVWPAPSIALTSSTPALASTSWLARLGLFLGFKRPDAYWEERVLPGGLKGVWMIHDPTQPPDAVVYYIHGGGFSMGSPWFYFEFLLALLHLLSPPPPTTHGKRESRPRHFANPAVFALDYTLVPTATFPTQLQQVLQGYDFVRSQLAHQSTHMPPNIELAGDSAGATLALSLLLLLASDPSSLPRSPPASTSSANGTPTSSSPSPTRAPKRPLPAHTTLISPWTRLISPDNADTPSDFLNGASLHLYARQYVGEVSPSVTAPGRTSYAMSAKRSDRTTNPLASPGDCADLDAWARALPAHGIHFVYGAEEVFRPGARALADRIRKAVAVARGDKSADRVAVSEEPAQIHAWPVVGLFLGVTREQRLRGLRVVADGILGTML